MNRQSIFIKFIALFTIFFINSCFAQWKNVAPGIAYQDLAPFYLKKWSHIHTFKIDLNLQKLKLVRHNDLEQKFPSIEQYAESNQAPLAINGGFFDNNQKPLGLRVSDYKISNTFKSISWWGVFSIKNLSAAITSARLFQSNKEIEFAIQAGPRLVINRHIPSLRPGYAERTALCVISPHEIAIIITQYFPISLSQLAKLLIDQSLNCQDALNLDGGSSTQLFAKFSNFFIHMPGLASVSDAIVVLPRERH